MTKDEFLRKYEEVTNTSPYISGITDEDYKLVEYVYNFHPSISETTGKDQIAYLVANFGMPIIKDMLPRAKEMEGLEAQMRSAQIKVQEIARKIESVKYGYS